MFNKTGNDSKIDVYALGFTFFFKCYFNNPIDILQIDDETGVNGVIESVLVFNQLRFRTNLKYESQKH